MAALVIKLSGRQISASTDRSKQTRKTQRAESSKRSGEDLGLYLGLYFRVHHCRTLSHRAWHTTCMSEDSCLSPAHRWLAVSPAWIPAAQVEGDAASPQLCTLRTQLATLRTGTASATTTNSVERGVDQVGAAAVARRPETHPVHHVAEAQLKVRISPAYGSTHAVVTEGARSPESG